MLSGRNLSASSGRLREGNVLKMTDGNKESIKELLATFRALFAIDVSAILLLLNLNARGELAQASQVLFKVSIAFAVTSLIGMVYLFFLAMPKISDEENHIIYQNDVLVTSLVSLAFFFAGYTMVALNIAFS